MRRKAVAKQFAITKRHDEKRGPRSDKCRGGAPRGETSPVGDVETPRKRLSGVPLYAHRVPRKHPAPFGALLPLAGREGPPKDTARPAPQNKRTAELCLGDAITNGRVGKGACRAVAVLARMV